MAGIWYNSKKYTFYRIRLPEAGAIQDAFKERLLDNTEPAETAGAVGDTITLADVIGKKYKSFKTQDGPKHVAETFMFTKEGSTYVTTGTSSGRNEYNLSHGRKLTHKQHGNIISWLQDNGDLHWSHGYSSRPVDFPDQPAQKPAKITSEYWIGKNAKSFKTGGSSDSIAEHFVFTKEGNTWVTTGEHSNRNCYNRDGNKIVSGKVHSILQANGDLQWSHGYTSRILLHP